MTRGTGATISEQPLTVAVKVKYHRQVKEKSAGRFMFGTCPADQFVCSGKSSVKPLLW
jgi:hypothetical protein